MFRFLTPIVVASVLLGGCSSPPVSQKDPPSKDVTAEQEASAPESGEKTTESAKAIASKVPSDLDHDGLKFAGLSYAKPLTFMIVSGENQSSFTQKFELKSVEDKGATFEVKREEQNPILGDQQILVDKTGVYTVGSTRGALKSKTLELPAKLKVGTTWSSSSVLKREDGQSVEMNVKNRVEKFEKIKIPAGEFETMVVSNKGSMKIADQNMRVEAKSWHVKDMGVIKQDWSLKNLDGKINRVTITLTHF